MGSTAIEGDDINLVESDISRSGALVARALVKPEHGTVSVSLLNSRAELVTIKAGSTIATLKPVEFPISATVDGVAPTGSISPDQERLLWQ